MNSGQVYKSVLHDAQDKLKQKFDQVLFAWLKSPSDF
jgi:uncharacterized protein YaaW (UPF0174 family)